MVSRLLRGVFGEHLMSEQCRTCLFEMGCNSRWRARCRKYFIVIVSVNGLDIPGMEKTWRKLVDEKIMFVGCLTWLNGCGNSDRAQEYISRKQCSMNEKWECRCNGENDGKRRVFNSKGKY